MRNSPISATCLVGSAAEAIGVRLPARWLLRDCEREVAVPGSGNPRFRPDAVWEIRDPTGLSSDIIVEVKAGLLEPRAVAAVVSQLQAQSSSWGEQRGAAPACIVIAPYLSPLTRERLMEAGLSYADSTGNIRFAVERPAVFIETQGAVKNPFGEDRALRSLKGGRAGRAVRALLDFWTPFGTRELAAWSASSPAMISRVSSLLEPDEIVTREKPRGRIVSVGWEALARRWTADYAFASSNTLTTWLEPRGTRALFGRLRGTTFRYAVTGSFAAYRLAPVAEPRLVALYADDPEVAAQSLGLRPAESGGNVLLVRPFDPVAFERTECDDGITYASVTQVLVDLMTGPGRGPAEAEALLEWMRSNEARWKLSMTETR